MPLFSNLAEVLPIDIFAMLRVVDIGRHRNEVFCDIIDDSLVRESGRTARNTIVSDTAQRVAVHGPEKQWPLPLLSHPSSGRNAGDPRRPPPLFLTSGGKY